MRWWPRANSTTLKFGRTLCRLWIVGTSLWIISCSVLVYNAYRDPYDLWLILDPADAKYSECWPEVPRMDLLATASVAIDGSKFKAVNNRDKNFT